MRVWPEELMARRLARPRLVHLARGKSSSAYSGRRRRVKYECSTLRSAGSERTRPLGRVLSDPADLRLKTIGIHGLRRQPPILRGELREQWIVEPVVRVDD